MCAYLIAPAEREHPSLVQHKYGVQGREDVHAMRDYDDNRSALAQRFDGARQRGFSGCIEIRIWFIEHYDKGLAIDGPSETDALALAG